LLGADKEQVRQLAQHRGAPKVGALRDRTIEFADQTQRGAHFAQTILVGPPWRVQTAR